MARSDFRGEGNMNEIQLRMLKENGMCYSPGQRCPRCCVTREKERGVCEFDGEYVNITQNNSRCGKFHYCSKVTSRGIELKTV